MQLNVDDFVPRSVNKEGMGYSDKNVCVEFGLAQVSLAFAALTKGHNLPMYFAVFLIVWALYSV